MKTSGSAIAIIASPTRYDAIVHQLQQDWAINPIDVHILSVADTKSSIGIAEVQRWVRGLYRTPQGETRLAIITHADVLTEPSYNALLKTIEEPPAHNRIVLLLGKDVLLPTIRSRVHVQYDHHEASEKPLSLLSHSVSDIIDTADGVAKRAEAAAFVRSVLTTVRRDVRAGALSAESAAAIAEAASSYSSGMSIKGMVERVLLMYREGYHDS